MLNLLLPALCLLALFDLALSNQKVEEGGATRRESFLFASLIWSALLVAISEGTSQFRALGPVPVASAWGVCAVVAAAAAVVRRRALGDRRVSWFARYSLSVSERFVVLGLALILGGTLLIALVSPGAEDAMSYHLARAAHWMQNQTLRHYPTHDVRQLYHPIFSELLDLQCLLSGTNDRLCGVARWICQGATLMGVSVLAQQLGAGRRGQLAAAVVYATLPVGILLVSSGKNDTVAALFLVAMVLFGTKLRERFTPRCATGFALALGLGMLTKLTFYMFALPYLIWFSATTLFRQRLRGAFVLAAVATVALTLNLPHYARNWKMFDHPLASQSRQAGLGVQHLTVAKITSNVLRQVGLQIATPIPAVNDAVEEAVQRVHGLIGVDASDPTTTYVGETFRIDEPRRKFELASNPLHFVLAFVAGCAVFVAPALRRNRPLVVYVLLMTTALLVYAAALKWQTTMGRMTVPLFALSSPLVALVFGELRARRVSGGLLGVLLVASWPALFLAQDRPLLGKESIFDVQRPWLAFMPDPALFPPSVAASHWLRDNRCQDRIGLLPEGGTHLEFPLWVELRKCNEAARIEHVNVTNASAATADRHPFADFVPQAVLAIARHGSNPSPPLAAPTLDCKQRVYDKSFEQGEIAIYTLRSN